MTDHDDFEHWLARTAPTLNSPTATPKQEMWTNISARLSASAGPSGHIEDNRPDRTIKHSRRWLWPLAVAAALVLGAAIDRLVLQRDSAIDTQRTIATVESTSPRADSLHTPTAITATEQVATDPKPQPRPGLERNAAPERVATQAPASELSPPRRDAPGASATLRLAATQTLVQAEMLLAAYRADDSTETRQLGRWARDVLVSTRLLLDSKVATDITLRSLLQDLELVLMQLAQLSGADLDDIDRDLLDRTLKDRDLLPRIRSAVPTGPAIISTTSTSD